MVLVAPFICTASAIGQQATQPAPVATTGAATSNASDLETQLNAIDRRAGEWKDLSADFEQEKQSPLLRKPLVSRGVVKAKGAASLWESTEPEPTQMSIDPQQLRLYYPKQKIVEEYPIQGQFGMMAASPMPRLATIRQNFSLSLDNGEGLVSTAAGSTDGRSIALMLKPVNEEIKRYVDHVRVLLDPDRGIVLAFEMADPDGERTVIRFTNFKGNQNLSDDAMKLHLPNDVKIVQPLSDVKTAKP